ncbi:hypothetical protein BMS3Bbin04_01258 [bacterium BMS3Bbin04]|nr:hypothetical protein BMS3Bbin04_01258 [bacterium BMS3Bbin04]
MRDHTQLKAWQVADDVVMAIYRTTKNFPREELFGLTSQMRRTAVSVTSNIVEGAARSSRADYIRFLDIGFASARELEYQIFVSDRLGYFEGDSGLELAGLAKESCKILHGLIASLRRRS